MCKKCGVEEISDTVMQFYQKEEELVLYCDTCFQINFIDCTGPSDSETVKLERSDFEKKKKLSKKFK